MRDSAVLPAHPAPSPTTLLGALRSSHTLQALVVLFLLAAVLRFAFIRSARLAGDEALYYAQARQVADGQGIPRLGPRVTSRAARVPGGSFVTLMALPLLVVNSPLACMAWVALLSLLGYALWTAAVRRWLGDRGAVIFAALLLFSPWSFFYSDRIWNPNVLILASGALLFSLTRMIDRPRSRHVFWVPLAILAAPQFHLSGLMLIPLAVVLFGVWRPKVCWWSALGGLAAGVLLYLPYLSYEIPRGFPNTRLLLSVAPDAGHGLAQGLRSLWQFFSFSTLELGYHVEKGYWSHPYQELRFYLERQGLKTTAEFFGGGWRGTLVVVVMIGTVVLTALGWLSWPVALVRAGRGALAWLARTPLDLTFALALVLVPLFIVLGRKAVHPHFIYLLYPIAYLPLLRVLGPRLVGRARPLVVCWLALVVPVGIWASATYYWVEDRPISVGQQEQLLQYIYDSQVEETYRLDIRMPRLAYTPFMLQQLSVARFRRPLREDRASPQRYLVLPRVQGLRRLGAAPPPRIDGRPLRGYRVLDTKVVFHTGPRR